MSSGISRDRVGGLIDSKAVYGDSSVEDAVTSLDLETTTSQSELLYNIYGELRLLNARFEEAFQTGINREDIEDGIY